MPAISVVETIRTYNAGRDPERLAMKFAKMKESPFVFLRGTCHLFYDWLPALPSLTKAPLAWCCGDLHFENFGSYKADNRLVYFDINDYDEAALAPCTWDIVRLLTSIVCGADALRATRVEAIGAAQACLEGYRAGLSAGKPLWVERETSTGLVHDLLDTLRSRTRAEHLDRRTLKKGGQRHLKIDGSKALSASEAQRDRVTAFIDRFAALQPNPGFFKVLDVARRIAGTGSLGVERFVVLVEGKGSPDGNYLLDLKEAKPAALLPHLQRLGITQPAWTDEARRVVAIQKRMQAVDHAFLFAAGLDGTPCLLKGLQPSEDRVAMDQWGKKLERLKAVVTTMGLILAWDQLRASGRAGAACADELIAFSQERSWPAEIFDAALAMAQTTQAQWSEFVASDK